MISNIYPAHFARRVTVGIVTQSLSESGFCSKSIYCRTNSSSKDLSIRNSSFSTLCLSRGLHGDRLLCKLDGGALRAPNLALHHILIVLFKCRRFAFITIRKILFLVNQTITIMAKMYATKMAVKNALTLPPICTGLKQHRNIVLGNVKALLHANPSVKSSASSH